MNRAQLGRHATVGKVLLHTFERELAACIARNDGMQGVEYDIGLTAVPTEQLSLVIVCGHALPLSLVRLGISEEEVKERDEGVVCADDLVRHRTHGVHHKIAELLKRLLGLIPATFNRLQERLPLRPVELLGLDLRSLAVSQQQAFQDEVLINCQATAVQADPPSAR